MKLYDLSHDTHTTYRLTTNEETFYVLFNRTGTIRFELSAKEARATILALSLGTEGEHALDITVCHRKENSASRLVMKTIAGGTSHYDMRGRIEIEKRAPESDASQTFRGLIASEKATIVQTPTLEIKTDDVLASHAATISSIDQDALFFTETRGLTRSAGEALLLRGFALDIVKELPDEFSQDRTALTEKIEQALLL